MSLNEEPQTALMWVWIMTIFSVGLVTARLWWRHHATISGLDDLFVGISVVSPGFAHASPVKHLFDKHINQGATLLFSAVTSALIRHEDQWSSPDRSSIAMRVVVLACDVVSTSTSKLSILETLRRVLDLTNKTWEYRGIQIMTCISCVLTVSSDVFLPIAMLQDKESPFRLMLWASALAEMAVTAALYVSFSVYSVRFVMNVQLPLKEKIIVAGVFLPNIIVGGDEIHRDSTVVIADQEPKGLETRLLLSMCFGQVIPIVTLCIMTWPQIIRHYRKNSRLTASGLKEPPFATNETAGKRTGPTDRALEEIDGL
ncbi:hypothetical protein N7523_005741 [Penicillium sp. IBT 18751x]|nr:hypothetical protein N7523_005666 [Penicillium sp. IBT 18751x]KAJ6117990.1 hypothetical protein N7523_005741 [Penicillium sp. IBT 18751x]